MVCKSFFVQLLENAEPVIFKSKDTSGLVEDRLPDAPGKQIGPLAKPKILCLVLSQVHLMHQVLMQRASYIFVPVVQKRA